MVGWVGSYAGGKLLDLAIKQGVLVIKSSEQERQYREVFEKATTGALSKVCEEPPADQASAKALAEHLASALTDEPKVAAALLHAANTHRTADATKIGALMRQSGFDPGLVPFEMDAFLEALVPKLGEEVDLQVRALGLFQGSILDKSEEILNRLEHHGMTYSRPDYRNEVSSLLDFYGDRFVGREGESERLIAFAAQQTPGYLLIEALGGYGKTTLMAQLVKRRETARWPQPKPSIVFFFIRTRGGRNTPEAFLQAVNAQLLDLLNLPGGTPTTLMELRTQFSDLWSKALAQARKDAPLLLLVDGLDERAVSTPSIADLLPSGLADYVHVAISSRPKPSAREQVGIEHPLRNAENLPLRTFDERGIRLLLRHYGLEAKRANKFALRILSLTGGEPLFARFVSEEVAVKGESELERLEEHPPADVEEYFHEQLSHLYDAAEGDVSWNLLGLFTVAHGGFTKGEMAEVFSLPSIRVREALKPIDRFLLGTDRLELFHHNLLGFTRDEFNESELFEYRRKVIEWCQTYGNQGWPESTPAYVLSHYATHLAELSDDDTLYELVATGDARNEWAEAHFRMTGSFAGYLGDLDLAWRRAEDDEGWSVGRQIRCALIQSSIRSRAGNIPANLLLALVDHGPWTLGQALGMALDNPDPETKFEALAALVPRLEEPLLSKAVREAFNAILAIDQWPRRNQWWQALSLRKLAPFMTEPLLREALSVAHMFDQPTNQNPRAKALAGLIPRLADLGYPEEALNRVPTIEGGPQHASGDPWNVRGNGWQVEALEALGEHLPEEWLDVALDLARRIQWTGYRVEAVAKLIPHLKEPRRSEELRDKLRAIPEIAEIEIRVRVLVALVPHLPPDLIWQAVDIAQKIEGNQPMRAWALETVISRLAELGYPQRALAIAAKKTDPGRWRAKALAKVVPHLPENGRLLALHDMVAAAPSTLDRTELLRETAPFLPEDFLLEELNAARGHQVEDRERLLAALVPRLAELGHPQEAYDEVLTFRKAGGPRGLLRSSSSYPWFDTLVALVAHLPQPLRAQALTEAFDFTQRIGDGWKRTEAITLLARHLPEPSLVEALRRDDSLMLAAEHGFLPDRLLGEALEEARKRQKVAFWLFAGERTHWSSPRAEALALLIPRLAEPLLSEALHDALEAAQEIEDPQRRIGTLALLVPYVPEAFSLPEGQLREDLAAAGARVKTEAPQEEAIAVGQGDDRERRAEELARRVEELVAEVRKDRPEIQPDPRTRDLVRWHRRRNLSDALSLAARIDDSDKRATALKSLVPYLGELLRGVFWESPGWTRSDMEHIEYSGGKSGAVRALAPYLPESSLQEALEAIKAIENADQREEALRALILNHGPLSPTSLHRIWSTALRVFAVRSRQELLENLPKVVPLLVEVGGAEAVGEAVGAVRDVTRWWP